MAFPKKLLTEGETIILDLRPHWITLTGAFFRLLLTLGATIAIEILLTKTTIPDKATWVWTALAAVAILAICITVIPTVLTWMTTQFVLTDERLIARSGVFAKRSKEIPLEVVNDITFTQSFFSRLVGAGSLVVESAGERGQELFKNIRKPDEIQKAIYHASESRKGLGAKSAPASASSVADEIAKLAALRDSGSMTPEEFEAAKKRLLEA